MNWINFGLSFRELADTSDTYQQANSMSDANEKMLFGFSRQAFPPLDRVFASGSASMTRFIRKGTP
jgi:hypothetical protein